MTLAMLSADVTDGIDYWRDRSLRKELHKVNWFHFTDSTKVYPILQSQDSLINDLHLLKHLLSHLRTLSKYSSSPQLYKELNSQQLHAITFCASKCKDLNCTKVNFTKFSILILFTFNFVLSFPVLIKPQSTWIF